MIKDSALEELSDLLETAHIPTRGMMGSRLGYFADRLNGVVSNGYVVLPKAVYSRAEGAKDNSDEILESLTLVGLLKQTEITGTSTFRSDDGRYKSSAEMPARLYEPTPQGIKLAALI